MPQISVVSKQDLSVARPFSSQTGLFVGVFGEHEMARLSGGEPVGYCTSAPIHAVAESGNVTLAKQLLSAGVDPEEPHSKIGTWAFRRHSEKRRC